MTDLTLSAALMQALTFLFSGSLGVSLAASFLITPTRRADTCPSKTLTALRFAWLFALLSALCLVAFTYTLAYADTLSLLHLSNRIVFSRPLLTFVFGALYLLPVMILVLEDKSSEVLNL